MIKVALVGFGLAGKNFHAPLISGIKELELSIIVSSRQAEIQSLYPKVKVVKHFSDIFNEKIDLIVIATPNEFHFEQAKIALNHKKHVVVDKPLAQTYEEGQILFELAQKNDCILSVFHNRRFDGDFLTVKKLLAEKKLGNIVCFESNFNRFRPKVNTANWRETTNYAGGLFFDLAPHLIDQCLNLFGIPESVFADMDCMRKEAYNDDYFHLIIKYPKMRAHLNASVVTASTGPRFCIHGDEDSYLKYGMDVQENQLKSGISVADDQFGVDLISGQLTFGGEIIQERGKYQKYYHNIAQAIFNHDELLVNSHDALNVLMMMSSCLESHKSGAWINLKNV